MEELPRQKPGDIGDTSDHRKGFSKDHPPIDPIVMVNFTKVIIVIDILMIYG